MGVFDPIPGIDDQPAARAPASSDSAFTKGLRSGALSAVGQLNAVGGAVGEALGATGFAADRYAASQDYERRAQEAAPDLNFRNVDGLRSGFDYVTGAVGSSIPVSALALAGALVTRGRGGTLGRAAGGGAATLPVTTGEAVQRQLADPVAAQAPAAERLGNAVETGLKQSALESLVPAGLAGRMAGPSAGVRAGLRRNLADVPVEAATETAGVAVQQAGVGTLNPDRDTSGDYEERIQGAVGGAAGGLGFAGVGAASDAVSGALSAPTRALEGAKGAADGVLERVRALGPGKRPDAPPAGADAPLEPAGEGEGVVERLTGLASDLTQGLKDRVNPYMERVAKGLEDFDPAEVAGQSVDAVKARLRDADAQRLQNVGQWAKGLLDDPEVRADVKERVQAAVSNLGDRAEQAWIATQAQAQAARQQGADALNRLADALAPRTETTKKSLIGADRLSVSGDGELPPMAETYRAALTERVLPLVEQNYPGLMQDPDRVNRLGEVLRQVITQAVRGEGLTRETRGYLRNLLGDQNTAKVLNEMHTAAGMSLTPEEDAKFFAELNSIDEAERDRDSVVSFLGKNLDARHQGSYTTGHLRKLAEGLEDYLNGANSAMLTPARKRFLDTQVDAQLKDLFGDSAPAVRAKFEQLRSKKSVTKSDADLLGDAEDGALDAGDRTVSVNNTSVRYALGGRKQDRLMLSDERAAAEGYTGESEAARRLAAAKQENPNSEVRLISAKEYAERTGAQFDPADEGKVAVAIEDLGEGAAIGPGDVTRMRADARYKDSPTRIDAGDGLVLDGQRIVDTMNRKLPYNASDEKGAVFRKARVFLEGVAAIQENLGRSFELSPGAVAFMHAGKAYSVGDVQKLPLTVQEDSARNRAEESLESLRMREPRDAKEAEEIQAEREALEAQLVSDPGERAARSGAAREDGRPTARAELSNDAALAGQQEFGPDAEIHLAAAEQGSKMARSVDAQGLPLADKTAPRKPALTKPDGSLTDVARNMLSGRAASLARSVVRERKEAGQKLQELAARLDQLTPSQQQQLLAGTNIRDRANIDRFDTSKFPEAIRVISRMHARLSRAETTAEPEVSAPAKKPVASSGDVASAAQALKGEFSDENVVRVIDALKAKYAPDMPLTYGGASGRASRGTLRRNVDGTYTLLLGERTTPSATLATVLHEFGHAMQFHLFDNAPAAVQQRIRDEWRATKQRYETDPTLTAEDFVRDFGSVSTPLGRKVDLKAMSAREAIDRLIERAAPAMGLSAAIEYPTKFEEYFANQFQKYVLAGADTAPTEVRGFWAQAVQAMRSYFVEVIKPLLRPKEQFSEWMGTLGREPVRVASEADAKKDAFLARARSGDEALLRTVRESNDATGLQNALDLLVGVPDPNDKVVDVILALNERLGELTTEDPSVAYALQTRKRSAVGGAGASPVTKAQRQEVRKYIARVLGKRVETHFDKMDYAGEFVARSNGPDIIRLSVHATDPMGTAFHEALHGFFAQLRRGGQRSVIDPVVRAAGTPAVMKQLRHLLRDEPAALTQLKDPEERAAYAFQFYAAGQLKLVDPAAQNVVQRVFSFLREVFGLWGDEQKAVAVFDYFHSGEYAANIGTPSAVERVLVRDMHPATEAVARVVNKAIALGERVAAVGHARLRDTGVPALIELADKIKRPSLEEADGRDPGYLPAARLARTEWMSRLGRLTAGHSPDTLRQALEGLQRADVKSLSREARGVALGVRKLLDQAFEYMSEAGVKVGDLGYGKDYFPRVWDAHYISSHQAEFRAMLEKYVRQGDLTGGVDSIMQTLMTTNGSELSHVVDRPGNVFTRERTLSFVSAEDAAPFMEKELLPILDRYLTQATRRAEWARRFSDGPEGLDALLEKAKAEGASADELRVAKDYVRGVNGTLGDDINPTARRLMGNTIVYQNIRLLPLALFSSIVDPLGIAVRGGTAGEAWKAFTRGIREMRTVFQDNPARDREYNLAEVMGTIDAEVLTNELGQLYSQGMVGGAAKRINDAFFRYNFMEQYNRSMRVAATRAAVNFITRHASLPSAHSERWMKELGLQPGDIVMLGDEIALQQFELEGVGMPKAEAAERAARLRAAVNMWVDGAILRPDAADRPIWFNDPHWALVSHLKTFAYSFHETILKRIAHEAREGNYRALGVALAYVPVTLAADFVRSLVQGGGEVPEWKKDWGLGDYLWSSVQRAGLFGVGQFAIDGAAGLGEGDMRLGGLAGPTLEQLGDAIEVAGGRRSFQSFVVDALPANGLYKHWDG